MPPAAEGEVFHKGTYFHLCWNLSQGVPLCEGGCESCKGRGAPPGQAARSQGSRRSEERQVRRVSPYLHTDAEQYILFVRSILRRRGRGRHPGRRAQHGRPACLPGRGSRILLVVAGSIQRRVGYAASSEAGHTKASGGFDEGRRCETGSRHRGSTSPDMELPQGRTGTLLEVPRLSKQKSGVQRCRSDRPSVAIPESENYLSRGISVVFLGSESPQNLRLG